MRPVWSQKVGAFQSQALRFALFGVLSNLFLYVLYLLLTAAGIDHKLAMTLLFMLGALITFILNKRWTFTHSGFVTASFVKHVCAYGFAYLLNLTALVVFVDRLALSHQLVQAITMLSLALMLFLIQKFWVFRLPRD